MSALSLAQYYSLLHERIAGVSASELNACSAILTKTKQAGGKVMVAGNGGSAGIASHVASDLTKACEVTSMAFNDSSLLTCFGNDFGYELWVNRALGYYARPGDSVILISSSGSSPNILRGAEKARELGLPTITLSGFSIDNPLRSMGTVNLWVDSSLYNIVENTHQVWLLTLVDLLAGVVHSE